MTARLKPNYGSIIIADCKEIRELCLHTIDKVGEWNDSLEWFEVTQSSASSLTKSQWIRFYRALVDGWNINK